MQETAPTLPLLILGVMISLLLLGAVLYTAAQYLSKYPCEKCGGKLVWETLNETSVGPDDPKWVDTSISVMIRTYYCLNRKCRHTRKYKYYAKPMDSYCRYGWHPGGSDDKRPD